MHQWSRRALATLFLAVPSSAWACGACGCTLNSDWASQGYAASTGFRFDLRYDYFNQDQLRSGTGSMHRGSFSFPTDQEIQEVTLNRNLTLTLDYSPTADWGLSLLVPSYDRYHSTIAEGDTDFTKSHGRGIGDVRLVGRYQGVLEDRSFGIQFGLKLPTGSFHQVFDEGVQAGAPLDRGLQRGSGTTDLLLGAYAFGQLAPQWGCFGQMLFQKPLSERDGFKPGDGINASLGVRYTNYGAFTPQLQLNVRAEGREVGVNADVANSGATLVYLSPGVTFKATKGLQIYAFYQVPVAQRVNGLQLEPRSSLSVGLHYAF
jgi:hypothetical protein